MDLKNIKQINLEELKDVGRGKKKIEKFEHWPYKAIGLKLAVLANSLGVQVKELACIFKSQRCSCCGLVLKANRKGKVYHCKHCGLEIDADLNSAMNHEDDQLPEIPYSFKKLGLNRKGFFWKREGFTDYLTGTSLESVPLVEV